jgi:hypothetical protein
MTRSTSREYRFLKASWSWPSIATMSSQGRSSRRSSRRRSASGERRAEFVDEVVEDDRPGGIPDGSERVGSVQRDGRALAGRLIRLGASALHEQGDETAGRPQFVLAGGDPDGVTAQGRLEDARSATGRWRRPTRPGRRRRRRGPRPSETGRQGHGPPVQAGPESGGAGTAALHAPSDRIGEAVPGGVHPRRPWPRRLAGRSLSPPRITSPSFSSMESAPMLFDLRDAGV